MTGQLTSSVSRRDYIEQAYGPPIEEATHLALSTFADDDIFKGCEHRHPCYGVIFSAGSKLPIEAEFPLEL